MPDGENISGLLSRRDALKLLGAGFATCLLPASTAVASGGGGGGTSVAMLYDATKCIGCRSCEEACTANRGLSLPELDRDPCDLTPYQWTVIKQYQGSDKLSFRKYQCMHCEHPACVSVCPVKAMQKLDSGPVVYDPGKCIGCRYCMVACPFHVPRIDWSKMLPEISKCNFCAQRIDSGLIPACAEACPVGALTFGTRDELLREAHSRIEQNPALYVDHVYGESEGGGTDWLYIASVPFNALGFPALDSGPVTSVSEAVATYGTPGALLVVGAMLGGIHWMSKRWTIDSIRDEEQSEEEQS
jgi:Fe-S-cluster-containing dehydrogenase component